MSFSRLLAALAVVAMTFLFAQQALCSDCVVRPRVVAVQQHSQYVAPVYHDVERVRVLRVAVQDDYYYSAQNYYQSSLIADAVVGRLIGKGWAPIGPGGIAPAPTDRPVMPPAKDSRPGGGEVSAALRKSIDTHCLKCHNDDGKKDGGLSLVDPTLMPEGQRWKMHGYVHIGKMPSGLPAISDAEVEEFLRFADDAGKSSARK